MRKVDIDFGLVLTFNVPDDMTDVDACGAVFDAAMGKGDPQDGINMNADCTYRLGKQISTNLVATGHTGLRASGSSRIRLSVDVDQCRRTI